MHVVFLIKGIHFHNYYLHGAVGCSKDEIISCHVRKEGVRIEGPGMSGYLLYVSLHLMYLFKGSFVIIFVMHNVQYQQVKAAKTSYQNRKLASLNMFC